VSRKTSQTLRIKELYYYIIDFRNLMQPELMPIHFVSKNIARKKLEAYIPNRNTRKQFSIIRGKSIKNENIPYKVADGNFMRRGSKYDYPDGRTEKQSKKSYRTLLRRRLRRMGLQTTVKTHFKYDEKAKKVKYKPNNQKVAMSPTTEARVFQLDRKPKRYYYIILKKRMSTKRGKLFKIKTIRVNIKTGNFRMETIHTMRNDIFLPELLSNLEKIPNAAEALRAYEAYKRKQKKVSGKHMA